MFHLTSAPLSAALSLRYDVAVLTFIIVQQSNNITKLANSNTLQGSSQMNAVIARI